MTDAGDRAAGSVPVRGLTVLYDAGCALCAHVRDWLARQPQLVPLELVPAGSEQARGRFPGLDHAATLQDVTVVGDGGQVYTGSRAWIVVLWALREHRPLSHRLSTPAGARLARGAVLAAAKWRGAVTPGAGMPGAGMPGAMMPGAGMPGAVTPGARMSRAGVPGAVGARPSGPGTRGPGAPAWGAAVPGPAGWGAAGPGTAGWAYDPARGWVRVPPSCPDGSCATG